MTTQQQIQYCKSNIEHLKKVSEYGGIPAYIVIPIFEEKIKQLAKSLKNKDLDKTN